LEFSMNLGKSIPPTALVLRIALGAWFVYSGVEKVFIGGLERFLHDISNYKIVGEPLDAIAAYTVPWFEIVAGLCLIAGILRRAAVLTIAALVCVFSICIGWAWFHQLNISCGCRGDGAPIQYWWKVAEFLGYFVVLSLLWWAEEARRGGKIV
jgi:uncharacterized membrane protein YphA (DoxX/SURF4 family)